MESSHNKNYFPFIFYILAAMGLAVAHLYFGFKIPLRQYELIGVIVFDLWLLATALIDMKTLYIPLWITAPVIIGLLAWRLIDPNYYHEPLIGFGLNPALVASGISFGFLVSDMITHFGNWFVKYPQSWQGLIAVWMSIVLILVNLFLPVYPLWLMFLMVCILRWLIHWAYSKNQSFQKVFNWLVEKPWLAYSLILGLLILAAFYTMQKTEKMNLIIWSVCLSFLLEEIFLPIFYKLFKIKTEEDQNPSVLGGGDAMLAATLGAYWGPLVTVYALEMAFLLAFLLIGSGKLINWLQKKLKNNTTNILQEMAFAPFIAISAQIIMLAEILVKL